MMYAVVRHLDWCQESLYDRQEDVLVGKCIRHGTQRSCSNQLNVCKYLEKMYFS
jgi:hypothetical protein